MAAFSFAVFAFSFAGPGRADEQIVRNGDKCSRFLPNIGRMVDVPCPSGSVPDTPKNDPNPPPENTGPVTSGIIELPEKGSALRGELMNAARPSFEYATGGPVIFVVNRIAVSGDWAFGNVKPVRPNGVDIDWRRTRFAQDLQSGSFQTEISFFLLKRVDGKWTVAEYVVGPSDVTWDGWRQQYNLPASLFGP